MRTKTSAPAQPASAIHCMAVGIVRVILGAAFMLTLARWRRVAQADQRIPAPSAGRVAEIERAVMASVALRFGV